MVLLSPKFLAYMKKGVTLGQKYYFHPFIWNESRNQPELSKSKLRLFLWYLNVLVTLLYSLFLVYRSLEVNLDDGTSNGEKIYMRFVVCFQAVPAMLQVAICLKKEEFSRFYIMTSQFFQQLDAHNWMSDSEPERKPEQEPGQEQAAEQIEEQDARGREFEMPKICELFFDLIWYGFFLAIFVIGVMSALLPHTPDKISSVLLNYSDNVIFTICIRIFCVLFQVYYNLMYSGNGFLWLFPGFSLPFPALVVLREIKDELTPSRTGSGSRSLTKKKVNEILRVYKSLEFMTKHFHQLYCTLIYPATKFLCMFITVVCTYGAIKMSGFLALFLAIIGLLALSILIAIIASLAAIHTFSEEILFLMKFPQFQQHLDLTGRKYVRALTLVKIKMGSSYVVDKECVVTVLQIVVDSTIDILLANS